MHKFSALQANVTENVTVALTNPAIMEIVVPYTFTAILPDGPVVESGSILFPSLAVSEVSIRF
jgi:hypothetical protein